MTRHFCTIFNAVYLVRGLALADSLAKHCPDHRLFVFAMDDLSVQILTRLARPNMVVIRREDFETPALLKVKSERGIGEYFWTCTSHIVRHCLKNLGCAECTYIDADVWLMSDPEPLFREMGGASVLLTEHRYTPRHDQAALSGQYCVQFMRFVADTHGLAALDWWCDRCIEWCFARREDGKFGDQKYLDDWTTRFSNVHVLKHLGGGIAPWNAERTEFRHHNGRVEVRDKFDPLLQARGWEPLVFFHFHGLMSYSATVLCFTFGYRIPKTAKRLVYTAYAIELHSIFKSVHPHLNGMSAAGVAPGASYGGRGLKNLLRRIWGLPNTVNLDRLA